MTQERIIPSSELIINEDGSIFHLHLLPEQLADVVILVGDPGRVKMIAEFFDEVECRVSNREFNTVTGSYKGKRMTVLSTGIGIGNIDITVTELDALANIDFATRKVKEQKRQLTLVRLGTSGALQSDIKVGDFVYARTSVGFDGLLNYYAGRNDVCDLAIEEAFVEHTGWNPIFPRPYFIDSDPELWELFKDSVTEGMTIAAPGFYAPQGRWVRLKPEDIDMNSKIESFCFEGRRITNYEMEGSALAGMAKLMGHRATTLCTIIAQRVAKDACTDYKPFVKKMIQESENFSRKVHGDEAVDATLKCMNNCKKPNLNEAVKVLLGEEEADEKDKEEIAEAIANGSGCLEEVDDNEAEKHFKGIAEYMQKMKVSNICFYLEEDGTVNCESRINVSYPKK